MKSIASARTANSTRTASISRPINALLAAMDGFESSEGIVVVAATNRPEDLDDALLRPGRFDRKVHVPYPDIERPPRHSADRMRKANQSTTSDKALGCDRANHAGHVRRRPGQSDQRSRHSSALQNDRNDITLRTSKQRATKSASARNANPWS